MHTVIAALVRIAVLGAALAGYYAALPLLFPDNDGGGANIGAGLIAFAAVTIISFAWALLDGRARGTSGAILLWANVAAVVAIGWLVVLALVQADSSLSVADRIRTDVFSLIFTAGLIIAPAAVGAAVGGVLRSSRRV